jgi:DNA-binding Lrp family transcriptional regulator
MTKTQLAGAKHKPAKPWSEGEDLMFAAMWKAGSTINEIADELERQPAVVHRHAKKLRADGVIPPRKRGFSKAHIAKVQADLAERAQMRLIKMEESFKPGPVTDLKRSKALAFYADGFDPKEIASALKMTPEQTAIVLRIPAPQGPHADLGKANALHRLDLMLAYPNYHERIDAGTVGP